MLAPGSAGGVSSCAVQLAAILGGTVTASGSARRRDLVLSLGAATFLATGASGTARYWAGYPAEIRRRYRHRWGPACSTSLTQ